jgi:tetraacyldisaccharide 4'-kinase
MISQPKFWKNRNFISDILLPLSFFYILISSFKNYFEKKFQSKLTIICVGNLTIGGSGKTPTVIYIAELLKNINYNVTVLLKGYGGALKGPLRVSQKNISSDVGDEALLHSKINETWVSNIRSKGVQLIEGVNKNNNLIIMDDGLQNNSVQKDINIAVFDGEEGIGNGRVIPSGPMRENLKFGLKKIKIVLIIGEDKSNISNLIKLTNNKIKIFYAAFEPDIKVIKNLKNKKVIAFAGIGFPNKFYHLLKKMHLYILET